MASLLILYMQLFLLSSNYLEITSHGKISYKARGYLAPKATNSHTGRRNTVNDSKKLTEKTYRDLYCHPEMVALVKKFHSPMNPVEINTANSAVNISGVIKRSLPHEIIGPIRGNEVSHCKVEKFHMMGTNPEHIIWIADTSKDLDDGKKAGIKHLIGTAFPWSVHNEQILREDCPECTVVKSPAELDKLVTQIQS